MSALVVAMLAMLAALTCFVLAAIDLRGARLTYMATGLAFLVLAQLSHMLLTMHF